MNENRMKRSSMRANKDGGKIFVHTGHKHFSNSLSRERPHQFKCKINEFGYLRR